MLVGLMSLLLGLMPMGWMLWCAMKDSIEIIFFPNKKVFQSQKKKNILKFLRVNVIRLNVFILTVKWMSVGLMLSVWMLWRAMKDSIDIFFCPNKKVFQKKKYISRFLQFQTMAHYAISINTKNRILKTLWQCL